MLSGRRSSVRTKEAEDSTAGGTDRLCSCSRRPRITDWFSAVRSHLLFAACNPEKETWTATVYPPGSGLTGRTLGNFPSLETCREACIRQVGTDGEYECALNCRPDPSSARQQFGLLICERTDR